MNNSNNQIPGKLNSNINQNQIDENLITHSQKQYPVSVPNHLDTKENFDNFIQKQFFSNLFVNSNNPLYTGISQNMQIQSNQDVKNQENNINNYQKSVKEIEKMPLNNIQIHSNNNLMMNNEILAFLNSNAVNLLQEKNNILNFNYADNKNYANFFPTKNLDLGNFDVNKKIEMNNNYNNQLKFNNNNINNNNQFNNQNLNSNNNLNNALQEIFNFGNFPIEDLMVNSIGKFL